jgi:hypothetical protein
LLDLLIEQNSVSDGIKFSTIRLERDRLLWKQIEGLKTVPYPGPGSLPSVKARDFISVSVPMASDFNRAALASVCALPPETVILLQWLK